jgi:hypothetical protein
VVTSVATIIIIIIIYYEMSRACSTNGVKRNAYSILVGKPEGKKPLRRPRRRWVVNIKMDLRARERMGWYGLD